ncbi:hypothetical protein CISG_07582 [Coccidioides immitis RMSCC 3703]|uniref:Uncharacterized protein n=1 Tax=Coccidioides immitis RMSCC 3703 TaxID=454286 RepID=A0A0J8R199_COCIT|nr:hypothetical protein CISG_07582 [Coccidioides immitis RMSCC 3703]
MDRSSYLPLEFFPAAPEAKVPGQGGLSRNFTLAHFSGVPVYYGNPPAANGNDRVTGMFLLGRRMKLLPKEPPWFFICPANAALVNGQSGPPVVRTLEELGAVEMWQLWRVEQPRRSGQGYRHRGFFQRMRSYPTHSRTRSQSLPHHPGQSPGTTEPPSSPERTWEPVPRPGSISSAVDGGDNPAMEGRDVTAAHAAPSSEDGLEAGDKFEASDDFVEDRGAK